MGRERDKLLVQANFNGTMWRAVDRETSLASRWYHDLACLHSDID